MEIALKTCLEMFEQRGYTIIEYDEDKINAVKQNGESIYAFMADTLKFNVNRVQEYISFMNQLQCNHGVIVYKNTITPMAKRIIENSIEIIIETFSNEELQYNITKHRLVPKHERLSKQDEIVFKKRFGVQIPVILTSDPISKFYGYKKGDIIKVTRKDGIIYRIVK